MGPRTQRFEAARGRVDRRAATRSRSSSGTAALHLACARARPRARRRGDRPRVHLPRHRQRAALHAARSPSCATSSRPSGPNLDAGRRRALPHAAHQGRDGRAHAAATPPTSARCGSCATRTGSRSIEDAAQALRRRGRAGAPGRHRRPTRLPVVLLQEAALRRRGRHGPDRRRGAGGARALAALARHDVRHLGPPHAATRTPTTWSTSATTSASTSRAPRSASRGCRGCATTSSAAAPPSAATARRSPARPG